MPTELNNLNLEMLEQEAEKKLEEARHQANEILAKANDEVKQILSSPLDLDGVRAQSQRTVENATTEANALVNQAKGKASRLKVEKSRGVEQLVTRIVEEVTGVTRQ
jgi:F0F1-type ATP synthase membrane subunit b/b'